MEHEDDGQCSTAASAGVSNLGMHGSDCANLGDVDSRCAYSDGPHIGASVEVSKSDPEASACMNAIGSSTGVAEAFARGPYIGTGDDEAVVDPETGGAACRERA